MQGFQDFFVAALSALVFACVVAKFVSVAFYGGDDNGSKVKVVRVVEQVNLGNAFKVRESRSKKRVKFVDDVVVRHVDQLGVAEGGLENAEEIKRVVFSGEEGVYGRGLGYVEGKTEKDGLLKCVDQQKVDEDAKILLGRFDQASEKEIVGEKNDIANCDQHLNLEEVNVSLDGPFSVKEENLQIGGTCEFTTEDKVIREETLISGSVLGGLIVDEKMNKECFSPQSYVDFVYEHATIVQKEDNIVERLSEDTEGGLSERDEEEDRLEVLGQSVAGGLSKKDHKAMKNVNVVIDGEDDDWEGIERTELEKVFAEAVNYVEIGLQGKDGQLAKLERDVQMQLYGLHKIAVEGSCHQAQPMALNFFARAKWNAWQKLGSMRSEDAMEEYIKLLTEHFPAWVQHFYDEDRGQSFVESGIPHGAHSKSSLQDIQPNFLPEQTKIEENSQDV